MASMILDGPSLTVSATMDVGKYTGSDGRLVVKSGNLFAGIIYVAGGGGPGHSTLHIVGSKASAIAVEDYLSIGVYDYLEAETAPPPSATELSVDCDATSL